MSLLSKITAAASNLWRALSNRSGSLRRGYVVEQYLRAGAQFGDSLSKLYLGECIDLEDIRTKFANLERRYAALGYRTVGLDEFIEYGAFGRSIGHLLQVKREAGEAPVYYAALFEQKYQEGFTPMSDFGRKNDWLGCGLGDSDNLDGTSGCDNRSGCRIKKDDSKGPVNKPKS